jgi:L,D-transpeptidase catalytic domain
MRVATKLAIVLCTIALCAKLSAQQTAVIINLTEQTAYLLEDGRVAFVSPIASGKEGWGSPIGSFRVISKDLNHQSGNFGLVSDSYGRIVNPNATPGSDVPPDVATCLLRCRTSWNSANTSGCMRVICLATRHRTVVFGCPETLLLNFLPECRSAHR